MYKKVLLTLVAVSLFAGLAFGASAAKANCCKNANDCTASCCCGAK